MTKAFISYSRDDSDFVDRIKADLEQKDELNATFDREILEGGDDLIEIFGEIGRSDAVICVLSKSSVNSAFVKEEMNSAIIKEIRERNFDFIPILEESSDFDVVLEEMGDALETILSAQHIIRFDQDYQDGINKAIKTLEEDIDPVESFHKATSDDSNNPFSRTRTENLKNDQMRAHLFAKPEPQRYEKLGERKPTIIEGARGTGKTMLLKSFKNNIRMMLEGYDSLNDCELNQFGVYIRASQGAFETQSEEATDNIANDVKNIASMTELILRLVESLIDEIQQAKSNGHINKPVSEERKLVSDLTVPLQLQNDVETLHDVRQELKSELINIQSFVNRRIINDDYSYDGTFIQKDQLSDVCEIINDYIPCEDNCIYFLVDEYENLLDFQKQIVNTLVKWSVSETFTFKIATKKPCFDNQNTLEDQELEQPDDYGSVNLNYNLNKEMKSYKELLKDISSNILKEREGSNTSIEELLENRTEYDDYTEKEIVREIIRLRGKNYSWWRTIEPKKLSNQINQYSDAAFYRLCDRDSKSRKFGGFEEFSRLSSGIVRHFLELCSMSYYFEKSSTNHPIDNGISVESQTEGVNNLSRYNLQRVRQNVDKYGPELHKLIIDIGDILEEKLLNHTSEPNAQIIILRNSDSISSDSVLNQVLYKAEESSVLIRKPKREPKNRTQPISKTFHINRIFTPALEIPSIYKWSTTFYPSDLQGLLDESTRKDTRERLMREKAMSDIDTKQGRLDGEYDNGDEEYDNGDDS